MILLVDEMVLSPIMSIVDSDEIHLDHIWKFWLACLDLLELSH